MKPKNAPASIVIYSYPQFVFAWPIIVFGLLLAGLQNLGVSTSAIAWTYIAIICLVMLAMGVDLGRNASIFCLVLFVGGWFFILWIQLAKNVLFFKSVAAFIRSLEPSVSSQTMVIVSGILAIIYVMMIAMVFLNDRWRFTSNEFEHRVWGRTDDSIARAAKRVTASYPDVLELLICFSGTIMIKSPSGDATIRTIKNVPLLPLRMKKLTGSITIGSSVKFLLKG